MSSISKKWETAFNLLAFKRDNPGVKVIEMDGEYYYKAKLLQEKKGGGLYYKEFLFNVNLAYVQ